MTDLLAKYGVNAEIRENASGDVILRNSTTGTEIRLADLIDVVGGANFADGATFPSDQKAFFGNDDQASIRYDATAGAWVVRDETAGEDGRDVQTIPSAGDAIEFASALGTEANPVPGTSHLESVSIEDLNNAALAIDSIQNALDNVGSGGTVIVPPGTYSINTLTFQSDQTLVGWGADIDTGGADFVDLSSGVGGLTFRNLNINMGAGRMDFVGSDRPDMRVENCEIISTGAEAIVFQSNSDGYKTVKNSVVFAGASGDTAIGTDTLTENLLVDGVVVRGAVSTSGTNIEVGTVLSL